MAQSIGQLREKIFPVSAGPSVLLLSGGLDSAANAALLSLDGDPRHLCLTVNYGQRAFEAEERASRRFAKHFGFQHQVIDIADFMATGRDALTNWEEALGETHEEDLKSEINMQAASQRVWVPNRNGVLIQIAASIAEQRGMDQVIVGFNCDEAKYFQDNTREFLDATSLALSYSTRNRVVVRSFTVDLTKAEIVQVLRDWIRAFPFDWLWPCYENGKKPCLKCVSCVRALEAGAFDSIPIYRKNHLENVRPLHADSH